MMGKSSENNGALKTFSKSEIEAPKTAPNSAIQSGLFCPNCGAILEAQKCKLFCRTSGCGYLVTCSEW